MPVQYGDVHPVLDDRHYRKINRRYGGPPVVVMDLLRNPPRNLEHPLPVHKEGPQGRGLKSGNPGRKSAGDRGGGVDNYPPGVLGYQPVGREKQVDGLAEMAIDYSLIPGQPPLTPLPADDRAK